MSGALIWLRLLLGYLNGSATYFGRSASNFRFPSLLSDFRPVFPRWPLAAGQHSDLSMGNAVVPDRPVIYNAQA